MPHPVPTPSHPLISVVMPVYNAAAYVGAAVRSILGQTYPHLELLIVDDGSTDDSMAAIEALAANDPRIRPLSVPHGGTSGALNAGVRAAAGDYIAILDSDDLALPERLAVQLDWIQRTGVDICGACVRRFGGSESLMWFPEGHEAVRSEMLFRCALLPSTAFARAAVLKDNAYVHGLIGQDYELWTRLAPRFRFGNVQRVLTQYRTHAKQISVARAQERDEGVSRHRRRYFAALFPDAEEEDHDALARVAAGRAHPSEANLERAGAWLVRLADTPDAFLRARMARRWLGACRRSARLGLACFGVYHRFAAQFRLNAPVPDAGLWLMCAARLPAGSRQAAFLKRLGRPDGDRLRTWDQGL